MADDLKNRGRSRINIDEDWELASWEFAYWSKEFGVSPAQLKTAVDEVGPSPQRVAEHFRRARSRERP